MLHCRLPFHKCVGPTDPTYLEITKPCLYRSELKFYLSLHDPNCTIHLYSLYIGFPFFPNKISLIWKWNDPEICCVNQNSWIILDQMKSGMLVNVT